MKETVLDVLMFLFEHYHGSEVEDHNLQETLREELTAAGFEDPEVVQALGWLRALAEQRKATGATSSGRSIRLYADQEMERLSTECRGFLHYLEGLGILSPTSRELVIERLLAIREEVDLERVKWVCFMVLSQQPGEEEGAWHLEDMLHTGPMFLH